MNKILFLSRYPSDNDLKDGMMQRIANVDSSFKKVERTYLHISFKRNLKATKNVFGNLSIIRLNLFVHFFKIITLIKINKLIYCHSLWNFVWISFFNLKTKKIVVDVHGVVPEELRFYNNYISSVFFSIIEYRLIKVVSVMIYVNTTMKEYYLKKYSQLSKKENLVCPILSKNVFDSGDFFELENFKRELKIAVNDVVFVYSGNIQKWQNFELVINTINSLNNINYKFIILTNQVSAVNQIVLNSCTQIKREQIFVFNVEPKELFKYYTISNYGFILRDDHVLNRVAMPTKLIEYMYYGVIPIVKLVDIGDFNLYGYEYLSILNVNDNLSALKSATNETIAKNLLKENCDIKELLFEYD